MKAKLLLAILFGSGLFVSCKKEGCTDSDAVNYNNDAKKDDGTCTYQGEVVIWYDQSVATNLINDGASSLIYYVNGELISSSSASVYWTGSPSCGENGSITITKDLGNAKDKSFTYSIKDQTGWEYWSGVLNFSANTCSKTQLTW